MAATTYEGILRDITQKTLKPVYYLMGEEPYYTDRLAERFANDILTDTEQEFNQTIVYGQDVQIRDVINMAKRFPMMAERQVVIVREAQNLKNLDDLLLYVQHPQPSTVLVFCHKNGALDRRKKLTTELEKAGLVIFESKKMKDDLVPFFIRNHVKERGLSIDERAVMMLNECVGNDLNRIMSEVDKICVNLTEGVKNLTSDMVEEYTGISKEYNAFELKNALIDKDILKANRIVRFMEVNPKTMPVQMVLATLFRYFADLMMAYYAKPRTPEGIKEYLDMKSTWGTDDFIRGMRNYNAFKVMAIISEIRRYDGMSKGSGATANMTNGMMRELVYFILH